MINESTKVTMFLAKFLNNFMALLPICIILSVNQSLVSLNKQAKKKQAKSLRKASDWVLSGQC